MITICANAQELPGTPKAGRAFERAEERGGLASARRSQRRPWSRRPCYAFVRDNLAIPHRHDAIRISSNIGLVGHHHDGYVLLAIERDQRLHDFMRCLRIEIAGGFVCEEQARVIDQRPRDGHPLLLPARKLARRIAPSIAEPKKAERRARPLETVQSGAPVRKPHRTAASRHFRWRSCGRED